MADGKAAALKRLSNLAAKLQLAEVTESTSYGKPALKVRDKTFCALNDERTMYLPCPLEMKELLMEAAPAIYFQTDHYKGWPGLLVRLDVIDDEELSLRLENAWLMKVPKTLAKARAPRP